MKLSARCYPAVLALVFLGGCSTAQLDQPSSASANRYYVVSSHNASFYRYGPQQGTGPDQRLARNTVLKLIQPSFAYCKVQLMDGEEGYVAKDDIHAASPALVAAVTAPQTRTSPTVPKSRLRFDDPRLNIPPEPLPLDLPEPTPIPETQSSPAP